MIPGPEEQRARSETRTIRGPEVHFRTEIRDPHSGFIAYVPPGSSARGEVLVKTGGSGTTVPCALCHGETLKRAVASLSEDDIIAISAYLGSLSPE